jgi:hypothetical protein
MPAKRRSLWEQIKSGESDVKRDADEAEFVRKYPNDSRSKILQMPAEQREQVERDLEKQFLDNIAKKRKELGLVPTRKREE